MTRKTMSTEPFYRCQAKDCKKGAATYSRYCSFSCLARSRGELCAVRACEDRADPDKFLCPDHDDRFIRTPKGMGVFEWLREMGAKTGGLMRPPQSEPELSPKAPAQAPAAKTEKKKALAPVISMPSTPIQVNAPDGTPLPPVVVGGAIVARVELITPEVAAKYLARSEGNRHIRKNRVEAYARDFTAGKGLPTNDGIAFNIDGTLKNGHHRLSAVVLAKVPVAMLVVYNLAREAEAVMDTGLARKYADTLRLRFGSKYDWAAGAIARAFIKLEEPRYFLNRAVPSNAELDRVLFSNEEAVSAVTRFYGKRGVNASIAATLAFAYPIDKEKVIGFAKAVESGENLAPGDPALALRRRLFEQRDGRGGGTYIEQRATLTLSLLALRAYLEGTKLERVQLPADGVDIFEGNGVLAYFHRRRAGKSGYIGGNHSEALRAPAKKAAPKPAEARK